MRLWKRLLQTGICFTLVILALCPMAFATVQTDSVPITGVKQAQSTWCWAACAEIVGKAVYPSAYRTQYDVVYHFKGTLDDPYPNTQYGTLAESAAGTQFVANNKVKFDSINGVWGFSKFVDSIAHGYPIQAAGGYYVNGKRNGGHMVVVYMTQFIDTQFSTDYYIDYYDPWDGITHHCTYNSFCNGSYNTRVYDQTVYAVY